MNDVAQVTVPQSSLTHKIKMLLEQPATEDRTENRVSDDLTTKSILQIAREKGYTLQQYVQVYPHEAVCNAEGCVAAWEAISEQATLSGTITTADSVVSINKDVVKLIKDKIDSARADLATVYGLLETTGQGNKGDVLISALYKRALSGKDTRALMYLMDRVEGRTHEAKPEVVDHDNAYNVYQILHGLFDKQLEVLNSGPGTKVIMCSRRSGKTHTAAAIALITCLTKPNSQVIYIGETAKMAISLIGDAINQIVRQHDLRDSAGNILNWKKFENGSKVLVRGLSNTQDPDLIRGNKAEVIIIDEFFHLKSDLLEYLQREVLEPMQLDYAQTYKQIFIGTPAKIRGTYGDHVWDTWDVPHFHWTYKENPTIEGGDEYVEKKLIEKGITTEDGSADWGHPYALREYLGQRAYETDILLYPEFSTFRTDDVLPQVTIDTIVCGIDYGVSDNDAVIGIAWDSSQRRGFVFYESKFNRLTCDKTVTMFQQLKTDIHQLWQISLDFFPSLSKKEANKRIRWDADTTDKQLAEELMSTMYIEGEPDVRLRLADAHRTDKTLMHDKIRDLLRTGALLLPENGPTAKECIMTVLRREPNGNVSFEVDDRVFHPDLLPAMRYALWNVIGVEVLGSKERNDAPEHFVGM